MSEQNLNKPILKVLETLELVGITFIRDYIQFLFDGPVLNTYTLPLIKNQNKIITSADFGYYDTLCSLINQKILSAYEDENEEKIAIKFESDIEFFVSLKSEDRNCVEAVMLQLETDGEWNVW
ncbi:hypothetical protein GCM10023091_20720 [Ravibacter arvi]|uniref:Uncharacterized protein n=1 Tax=Ravibacter arvi TaxID=2051041 RepID=A0ABP8LYU1_9BACT